MVLFPLFCFLCLAAAAPVQAAPEPPPQAVRKTVPDPGKSELELVPERSRHPYLELHGDLRWLYGKGRFSGRGPTGRRQDQSISMAQRRLRLFPTLHTSPDTRIKAMLEDRRDDRDHTGDRHLYLSRLYLESVNGHTKWELGRFNYYLMDGNVIDKRVDGIRASFGRSGNTPGRLTFFAGQTAGDDHLTTKKGWSLLYDREQGKWKGRTAYLDFRNRETLPALFPFGNASRSGTRFDRQQIWTTLLEYRPKEKWNLSLELLQTKGRQHRDQYRENERGFVAAVTYGQLDEKKAGSHEAWLRYYDQPQSSILYHTMDGDTGFFRRMGFRGWGARLDYVVTPGLVWAVEGFRLQNRKAGPFTRDFHEFVLGTSLTAYF